ncbi:hypothetical protein DPMN_055659 [Dreissena polymorpha]|uniref:Uncharacterized protein n=1 Tax=Dreissena polymorpha TaxID=45954 RepID=A0A9D4CT30_DREPO|nr:hypothetical protein DPMN_055659 [Dreissena polymorpha]
MCSEWKAHYPEKPYPSCMLTINSTDITQQYTGNGLEGVRKKPPPEETPFAKNGRAEETPFHSLHTRKKPPLKFCIGGRNPLASFA